MPDERQDISERELRLLKSGHLSLERELELYEAIAKDPALIARFQAATPFTAAERKTHVEKLLAPVGAAVEEVSASRPQLTFRRAWDEVKEAIRSAFPLSVPRATVDPAFGLATRASEADETEGEFILLSQQAIHNGDQIDLTVSLIRRRDGRERMRRFLSVTLVNLEDATVVPGQRLRLKSVAFTDGEQSTNAFGVAEFPIAMGGRWLFDEPERLTGDLVLTLLGGTD